MSEVNWNHPLNQGLSSWHIVTPDTVSGPTWRDLCGNYDGLLTNADVNTCWYGSTRSGQWGSLKHAGGTDSVALASGGGLAGVQSGTISLWVMWTSTSQEILSNLRGCVCGRGDGATYGNQIIALDGTNPNTGFITWLPYATSTVACTSIAPPGANVWHHVAVTYKDGLHKLYVDGMINSTDLSSGTINSSTAQDFTLGAFRTSNLIGMFDCFRIYPNRILSDPEILEEYNLTQRYSDELFLRRRRFTSPGSTFNPAWAARCNRYSTAGILT